jgi:HEPN domain-containing protein
MNAKCSPNEVQENVTSRGLNVITFLRLAFDDYVAARTLFLNNMLPQACALAATSVEKHLKAILAVRGNRCPGHLTSRLFNSLENYQPELYRNLNIDYLKFLSQAYELRYLDDKKPGFGLVINKYRALAELDRMIPEIEKGFNLQSGGEPIQTPLRQGITKKTELLFQENHMLQRIPKGEYFRKINDVFELLVAPDGRIITATYKTQGVNDNGSFLKTPELPDPSRPSKGRLSGG